MSRAPGPVRLLALALLVTAGCGRGGGAAAESGSATEPVASVRVRAVETRAFEDEVQGSGQWRSGGDLVVTAPFPAVVETLSARVGDRVEGGQALGMLVTRESWATLRGAELLLREAHDGAARAEAERALRQARREVVRVPLTATQAAVVVRRSAEVGAQVAETAEILALVPSRAVVFEAHVAAGDSPRLRLGQPGTVIEPGRPPRAVTVQRLLPMANSSDQSALVWLAPVALAPPPDLDRFGAAHIRVGSPHQAPAVPDSAVSEDDLTGERRVAVVGDDHRITWTTVTLGAGAEGWHEVLRPALAPGSRVVVDGQRGLGDRARVQWTP